MRKAAQTCAIIMAVLLISSYSYAKSPQISAGFSWLNSAQTATGNWPGVETNDYHSTAAALDAVFVLEPTNPAYTAGLQWMNVQMESPTDYLSRRIIGLKRAGLDASSELESLLLYRIAIGSWSIIEGFDGNVHDIIDTTLALQALSAANYTNTTVIGQSLSYLTSNQNADGGWGFAAGDDSSAYITSIVLRTLSVFNSSYINQDAISKASAYLLTKQNTDGGFGSSPSNVYETALSVMSLIESGNGNTQAILNGINYLASTQSPDGSWNQDPYYTALALQALASARPNLTVSSISFSKSMPQDGEVVTITATVSNTGLEDASGVIVRFYQGDPLAGGVQIGSDQIIPSLSVSASAQVSITTSFSGTGNRTLFVVVDPDGIISETSEADNKASSRIWVATAPDLAVFSEDLKPSTYVPASGAPFPLEYKIRNLGESSVGAFSASLYDGNPASGGTLLQTINIAGLAGTEVRTGTIGVTLTGDGAHTLYLTADHGSLIPEISDTNNVGSVTVQVGGVQKNADLTVGNITLTPSRPTANQTIQIAASVRNQGVEDSSPFTAEIFDGAPEAGGVLIYSTTATLAAGAEQTITTNWTVAAGIHDVYLIVDRMNGIVESDEANNRASVRVMTDMVDITLSATDLSFSIPHPVSGDSVVLSVGVRNDGIMATGPFNLALYDGDPSQGGTLLKSWAVADIASDATTTLPYTFTATPWTYRFYAVADTENVVAELYETNNQAIRSLTIKAPGETYGPDLVPVRIDLASMATDSRTLTVSGSAHVTFQNKGDDKITSSFAVLVFEDTDLDSRYTSGVDSLLGTAANTLPLWPEGAGMVSVPLSGTVKFLHSPLYVLIDSGDAILEQNEDNNLIRSGADCENRPLNPIIPVLKWSWKRSDLAVTTPRSTPVVANLVDTNGDGNIDTDDIPTILLAWTGGYYPYHAIEALRGDTGQSLFTIKDINHPTCTRFLSVGDIDGDTRPEIIFPAYHTTYVLDGMLAYNEDGTLKWDNMQAVIAWNQANPYTTIDGTTAPSIADIDGDGRPEIVSSVTVINADGSVRWGRNGSIIAGYGYYRSQQYSIVVDLDMDGKQEIIAGNTAYNYDGTIKWFNSSLPDGIVAIGNFDEDTFPEIVLGGNVNNLYLLDHNGQVKWGPVYLKDLDPTAPINARMGPPLVADFDGDGNVEIGVKGYNKYFILDASGKVKNALSVSWAGDGSSHYSLPTVFDLNGDGRPEVLIQSDFYFRIFDGREGTLLYQEGGRADYFQNVIVADVDGDRHADIIVANHPSNLGDPALKVYQSKNNDWVRARKVWNQTSYHVTNINDDGTIPQYESPSWLLNNSYLCQTTIGESPNPYLTPNLTASYLRGVQQGADLSLTARIGNGGAKEAQSSATVTFYDGAPSAGVIIGTAATTKTLAPGEYQDITYSWTGATEGLHHIYAVVDNGNAILECREDDNQASVDVSVATGLPDLKIGVEDITLPATPYYEGSTIPIMAIIRNQGSVSVSNVTVRLYNGSPSAGGTQIGATQTISSIAVGGTATLTFSYDTLGRTGANVLHVLVDQENNIVESSETNNLALITLDIQPPMLPNLTISADSVQIAPGSAQEGESVTVTATITNRGASVGNVPVRITVARGMGQGGEEEIYAETKTLYPILGLGQSATVTGTFDTTGWAGQQTVHVTIDPANTIAESQKDDNTASKAVFIQSAGLATTITLGKAVYQANETVTAAIRIVNAAADTRTLSVGVVVKDSAGNVIAIVSSGEVVTLGPSNSVTLAKTWNTGKTLSGDYSFTAEIAEDGNTISRVNANFSIIPDKSLQAKATTDKISYNPNETAAITSTITSTSANYIFENLTAVARVMGQGAGEVLYTDTKSITTLMPGASFTFKSYWNTGTYAPGVYPVSLEVQDASGAVIATGTQTLTISSMVKPSTVLRGHISVDKQSLLSGETATVSYTVTNTGNIDFANVALSVLTVHVVNQTVYDTLTSQTTLSMGGTYTGIEQINTLTYSAKDYLVVLSATIEGVTETLSGTYFRVEGAPTAPSLAGPETGSDAETFTSMLSVNNASDPNDDRLTYEFELYADSGLAGLVSSSGMLPEAAGTTAWTDPLSLIENRTYYWRSRAYDGKLYGPWMTTASFRVNTVNDPPTAPAISSPADYTEVDTLTPVLTVANASDPDSANLTYNFDIALEPGFSEVAASGIGVLSGQGSTAWQMPVSLQENATYYWRAQADDWLSPGPWSKIARFLVNTANDAPTAPVIVSPLDNTVVPALSADIVVNNSTDPDSTVISYFFEADRVTTFNSDNVVRSNSIPEGQGTTLWHIDGLLDNSQYYVRAKASDGSADSPWSTIVAFFANTANDAPSTPVLANPSNGAGVSVFTPILSMHNSTDPDRDVLTYEFEVYADAGLTTLVTDTTGISESSEISLWAVPIALAENQTYYWRGRAYDGSLASDWMPAAFFMINTANDAPGAPTLSSPIDGGAVTTLLPALAVQNAADPDSDTLTYDFEIYSAGVLAASVTGVPGDISGITSATLTTALSDNTVYQWRSRAFDGDRYGPWTVMANFTVHIPRTSINATIDFDPDTLNQTSNGTWVVVYIELPEGYMPADVDVSSIRIEGTIPAESKPFSSGDHDKDGIPDLAVKFRRSDVIAVLPNGDKVPVHVTGRIGAMTFEGVDIIRVLP